MLKVCFVILCIVVYAKTDVDPNYKACDNGKRLCVPFYLCDQDSVTGSELRDPIIELECEDYFEVCCETERVVVIESFSLKCILRNTNEASWNLTQCKENGHLI
jgi:hypothetical protein